MNDLISRSELLEIIKGSEELLDFQKDECIACINSCDIAYDIDKVVNELKDEVERWEDSGKEYNDKCEIAVARGLRNAIKMVKQGGVETETETIRDKAVKWNNNSSKRVPYEFIDYVEGKREIGVADDVCEWKQTSTARYKTSCGYKLEEHFDTNACYCKQCGKKIKAVE